MNSDEIYLFRVTRRLRQVDLAREAGISQPLLSMIEGDIPVAEATRQKVVDAIVRLKAETARPARTSRKKIAA